MRGGAETRKGKVLYRVVFEGAGIGLCVIETDGRIFPNQAFAAVLGYRVDELIGTRWQALTHPEDVESEAAAIAALAEGKGENVRLVKRYLHKTGKVLWGETIVAPHRGKDGAPAFMIASMLDVTERKQMEDDLGLQNAILATEHEAVPEGILVVDTQRNVVSLNRRFIEICRIPQETATIADNLRLLAEAEKQVLDPETFRKNTEAIYREPLATSRDEIALKSGQTIERTSAPMLTQTGENLGRLWCFRDITEAKRAADTLRDRLSELERWQDVMLDREERVAELKQEVNELCARLGEAARYASVAQDEEAAETGPLKVTASLPTVPELVGPEGEGV